MDQDEAGRLINRLRRVEGQSRGLQRMIEQGRPCEEIFTQLAATKAALDRVGVLLISLKMRECLNEEAGDAGRLPRGRREGPRGLSQVRPLREVAGPGRRVAEKFDPTHADKLENPERLVELPPAKLVELLRLTRRRDRRRLRRRHRHVLHPPRRRPSRSGASSPSTSSPQLLDRLRAKLEAQPVRPQRAAGPHRGRAGAARRRRRRAHAHRQRAAPRRRRPRRPGRDLPAARARRPARGRRVRADGPPCRAAQRPRAPARRRCARCSPAPGSASSPSTRRARSGCTTTSSSPRSRPVSARSGAGARAGRRRGVEPAGGLRRSSPTSRPRTGRGSTRRSSVSSSPSAAGPPSSGRASASPSRSTSSAPRRRRRPSPRTPRRSAACCARSSAAGAEPFVADSPGGPNGPAKVARAYKLSGIADVCAAEGVQIVDVEDDRAPLEAPGGQAVPLVPRRQGVPGRRRHRPGRRPQDPPAHAPHRRRQAHLRRHPGPRQGAPARQGAAARGLRRHAPRPAPRRAAAVHHHRRDHRHGGPGARAAARRASWTRCSRPATASRWTRRSPTAPRTSAAHVLHGRRVGAPRAPRPRRPVPPRRRPHRARARLQAGPPRHAGAPAAVAAPPGAQPHHGAAAPRRRPTPASAATSAPPSAAPGRSPWTRSPDYDDSACVRCFACTEVCPTAAIDNVSPLLVRLFSRGR